MTARAVGLLLGHTADLLFGDPRKFHPVAGFGHLATATERWLYSDSRSRGIAYAAILIGGSTAAATFADRRTRRPFASVLLTATATWAALGGRSLDREARSVYGFLDTGDLDRARRRLTHLVGRETASLSADEVARAVIESVAENTGDAVVASHVWGALAGVPGLVAHRAANTLDAMVGHHNARYERFGWAAARFDDLIGIPGSRLASILTVAAAPDRRGALTAWRRDAPRHPSPNAGAVEASFAGALGIRLGGLNTYYGNRTEHRAPMGDGRPPSAADIPPTVRVARNVGVVACLASVSVCLLRAPIAQRRRRRTP
ncbi:adenosylcobinamide-phosphate synthase CbiB [Mycobacterium paragordonae]|jgi:adenosylcobinamide-phosphate synthase|uniref:adenosylcobinamide-phosphate synthase CbiB n=1 Tax=Mycobacterium paragordonae TaxID=1389713 RepID=UPI0012E27BDF|nr:adenosylcobinamide-phosphate synthase CbiB [Mycobacterium paragordonae]